MGLGGLEPPTSRLSSARSNQLSYKPSDRVQSDTVSEAIAPQRPTGRRGLCRAPAERQQPARLRYGARAQVKVIREERETKAADARFVCATVRVTLFRLVPSALKGRGSKPIRRWRAFPLESILRKEVIQPQVPLRLPCYDFTPVADPTVVSCLLAVSTLPSGKTNSHGVTGGVYKARERIHRGMLNRDY